MEKNKIILLTLIFIVTIGVGEGFYVHEEAQGLGDGSDITTIKIEYSDNITDSHFFPDSFWVEIKTNKADSSSYKFEFELIDDPNINSPVNLWTTDLNGKAYKRHHQQHAEFVESWASYTLVNSDSAMGVATLIRNNLKSNSQASTSRHRHLFRMLGSITYENNFIEIVPYITKEQQSARKRRSLEEGREYVPVFDQAENVHMVTDRVVPKFEFPEPMFTGKLRSLPTGKIFQDTHSLLGRLFRNKRQATKTQYYAEVLAVIDRSCQEMHERYYQIQDKNLVRTYVRIYYSHMFSTINNYYQTSFAKDKSANFNIVLSNILFDDEQEMIVTGWKSANIEDEIIRNQTQDYLNLRRSLSYFSVSLASRMENLPFEFDIAVGIFNKDFAAQMATAGTTYLDGVCSKYNKYVIAQDLGGALTGLIIAHEIGHNLGAEHDGVGTSEDCPFTDNFMMTPNFNTLDTLETNNYLLSTCSREAIKMKALTESCLNNVPISIPEIALIKNQARGQIFDANSQCRLMFGENAAYADVVTNGTHFRKSDSMCTYLFCKPSLYSNKFVSLGPAFEGTACGSGKWCSQGFCVTNSSAPTGDCLYGDTTLTSIDGKSNMDCETGLQDLSALLSASIPEICAKTYYGDLCCSTCKKYTGLANCTDKFKNCDSYWKYCGTGAIMSNDVIADEIDKLCPVTCGLCSIKATCAKLGSLCKNGATCTNNPIGKYGFTCNCRQGFSGALCEYRAARYSLKKETHSKFEQSESSSDTTFPAKGAKKTKKIFIKIIAVLVGAALIIAVAALVGMILYKRNKRQKRRQANESTRTTRIPEQSGAPKNDTLSKDVQHEQPLLETQT